MGGKVLYYYTYHVYTRAVYITTERSIIQPTYRYIPEILFLRHVEDTL